MPKQREKMTEIYLLAHTPFLYLSRGGSLSIIAQWQKCHNKPFPLVYYQSHNFGPGGTKVRKRNFGPGGTEVKRRNFGPDGTKVRNDTNFMRKRKNKI